MIYSPEDKSSFITSFIEYSISDDTSIGIGTMLYTGNQESEFGNMDQSYYLRLKVTY